MPTAGRIPQVPRGPGRCNFAPLGGRRQHPAFRTECALGPVQNEENGKARYRKTGLADRGRPP
jgi:hypothetical protein